MDYIPLRMGVTGPQVLMVQRMLLGLGYPVGEADGTFGVRTQRAVIAFQSDAELPVDGIVAANTWMALERCSGGRLEPEEIAPVSEARPEPMPMPEARPTPLVPPEPPVTVPVCPLPPLMRPTPPGPPMVALPSAEMSRPQMAEPPIQTMPLIDWGAAQARPVAEIVPPMIEAAPESAGGVWTKIG